MSKIEMPEYYSFDREFYVYIKTVLPPAQANKVFGAMLDYFFTNEINQKLSHNAELVVRAMMPRISKRREAALNKMRNRKYATYEKEMGIEFEPMGDDAE